MREGEVKFAAKFSLGVPERLLRSLSHPEEVETITRKSSLVLCPGSLLLQTRSLYLPQTKNGVLNPKAKVWDDGTFFSILSIL